jgi:hypothetical protein
MTSPTDVLKEFDPELVIETARYLTEKRRQDAIRQASAEASGHHTFSAVPTWGREARVLTDVDVYQGDDGERPAPRPRRQEHRHGGSISVYIGPRAADYVGTPTRPGLPLGDAALLVKALHGRQEDEAEARRATALQRFGQRVFRRTE